MVSEKGMGAHGVWRAGMVMVTTALVLVAAVAGLLWVGWRTASAPDASGARAARQGGDGAIDPLRVLERERTVWRAMRVETERVRSASLPAEEAVHKTETLAAENEAMTRRIISLPPPAKGFDPRSGVVRSLKEQREYLAALLQLCRVRVRLADARAEIPQAARTADALSDEARLNPGVEAGAARAMNDLEELKRNRAWCERRATALTRTCDAAAVRVEAASSAWQAF